MCPGAPCGGGGLLLAVGVGLGVGCGLGLGVALGLLFEPAGYELTVGVDVGLWVEAVLREGLAVGAPGACVSPVLARGEC